ncbi:hypothetical protein EV643_13919 [Kribbella sp. VKM Ac-2527]|uniref:Uncharacterized protein n=1 Tax=Kribbella caucasensis TaxID=2512215 RepID=A0A4R6J4B3_9ACTN|nr:hypothetical protein EV643_13919 [Kribbella sp. VKM Ac-2527]
MSSVRLTKRDKLTTEEDRKRSYQATFETPSGQFTLTRSYQSDPKPVQTLGHSK